MNGPCSVTALLGEWSRGDHGALDRLLPLVYAELRRMAARQLRSERPNHTLQPTALVHEAYLRLVEQRQVDWQGRAHFVGVAAQAMRRILVDHARRHTASKRGGGVPRVSLEEARDVESGEPPLLAFDDAHPARSDGRGSRPHRRTACLWRPDHRRNRARAEGVAIHGQARLAHREGVDPS